MTPSAVFGVAITVSLLALIVLAVVPRRRWTLLVTGTVVPLAFAVTYAGIVAVMWSRSEGGFSTLSDVALLFSNPWVLLAGWLHYLAFDLFVGTWEVRDAAQHGIPHLLVVPCLALTFMFGPAGWLLYNALRAAYR
jgi:hypothetical protein